MLSAPAWFLLALAHSQTAGHGCWTDVEGEEWDLYASGLLTWVSPILAQGSVDCQLRCRGLDLLIPKDC